jgi:hypothetical protein
MIDACKGRADWRTSLAEFLGAEFDVERTSNIYKPGDIPLIHVALQQMFRFNGDPATWAASTDIGTVQRAVVFCVQANVTAPLGRLKVEKEGKGFELRPYFALPNLWDALEWMLWYDEWNRWAPQSCPECHKIFRPLTAHVTKYCSHKCAHRATNRVWRRKDLRRRKSRG